MTPARTFTKQTNLRKVLITGGIALTLSGGLFFTSCGSGAAEYVEETVSEPTGGLITEVEEIEKELFKITDETPVTAKDSSLIVAHYMDGKIDSFTLAEARLVDANSSSTGRSGVSSGLRSALMGGVMGYFMGKSMSKPISSSAYKSPAAYNKVKSSANSTVQKTAKRTTVKKPVKSSRTRSSSRSSRSFGG